jgi:superfamily II DNA or RNA helicase
MTAMPSYLDHFADYEEGQLDFFVPPKLRAVDMPLAEGARARDYGLRYYQEDAKEAVEVELAVNQSTLVVMATGCGKTQLFGAIAGDWEGDVLVMVHRDELLQQAKHRLELMTGEEVDVEQGQLKSDSKSRLVVASVQSLNPSRLARLGKDRFSLIIADEAHHFTSRTYRRAWEYFNAKKLGVTATPDRGDEKALGRIVESVAYVMDISEGIDAGYLVPLRARSVELGEIDLSGVGTAAGDLIAAQLDEAMLKAVEGIVTKTLELEPGRQGIAFFPGVKSAELAAQRFNALKPHSAAFVSGETDPDERRRIVKEFKDGRIQYLANCQIATEGFDAPATAVIIQGRPTKSRSLYSQMVGRGTRPVCPALEELRGSALASERRRAIEASSKPSCCVLDFVGNVGKHSLVGPVDILGGNYSEDEVKEAKKLTAKLGGDPRAALEAARAELRRIAAQVRSKVTAVVSQEFDPFSMFGIDKGRLEERELRFGRAPIRSSWPYC